VIVNVLLILLFFTMHTHAYMLTLTFLYVWGNNNRTLSYVSLLEAYYYKMMNVQATRFYYKMMNAMEWCTTTTYKKHKLLHKQPCLNLVLRDEVRGCESLLVLGRVLLRILNFLDLEFLNFQGYYQNHRKNSMKKLSLKPWISDPWISEGLKLGSLNF